MPGVSYECASQTHAGCKEDDCRCRCHLMAKDLIQRVPAQFTPNPPPEPQASQVTIIERICSKCGSIGRPNDKFCRKDGTELKHPFTHCGQCGAECPKEDLYCASCGQPLTEEVATITQQ